jgi:hypothetical protein
VHVQFWECLPAWVPLPISNSCALAALLGRNTTENTRTRSLRGARSAKQLQLRQTRSRCLPRPRLRTAKPRPLRSPRLQYPSGRQRRRAPLQARSSRPLPRLAQWRAAVAAAVGAQHMVSSRCPRSQQTGRSAASAPARGGSRQLRRTKARPVGQPWPPRLPQRTGRRSTQRQATAAAAAAARRLESRRCLRRQQMRRMASSVKPRAASPAR